jgi:hypothetical protein
MGAALRKICKEYLKDFTQLKARKLESQTAFDYIPDYRLTVDRKYRHQLERKIGYLYSVDYSNECYHILCLTLARFVDDLRDEILKID